MLLQEKKPLHRGMEMLFCQCFGGPVKPSKDGWATERGVGGNPAHPSNLLCPCSEKGNHTEPRILSSSFDCWHGLHVEKPISQEVGFFFSSYTFTLSGRSKVRFRSHKKRWILFSCCVRDSGKKFLCLPDTGIVWARVDSSQKGESCNRQNQRN